MNNTYKDRDLSVTEFFHQKQLEYLSYKLRSLIYKGKCVHKEKFRDISEKIKKDIDEIAKKKRFKSIFNDDEERANFLNEFFPQIGLPKFQYKDSYQKKIKGHWDKIYWFSYSAILREGECIGKCNFVDTTKGVAKVNCNGEIKEFSISNCERIDILKYLEKMF